MTNLTIFSNNSTGSGLYLASEFDFGNGFDFNEGSKGPATTLGSLPVSYTHLDVYKRQTYDFADNWLFGYDSRITCGIWVGFLEGKKPIYNGACLLYTSRCV